MVQTNSERRNALLRITSKNGNSYLTGKLLDINADLNTTNKWGETPLLLATKKGNIRTSKKLIKSGADVNAKNIWGDTPLHFMIYHGNIEIISMLLDSGANVSAKDKHGNTPLSLAEKKEILFPGITKLLNEKTKKRKQIFEKIKEGNLTADQINKCHTQITDENNNTLLHLAIEYNQTDIINQLLELGADVNAKNLKGKTPLHFAAEHATKEIVKKLIDKGADVNAKSFDGKTPLHFAAKFGQIEIIDTLVNNNARLNARNKDRNTPILLAIKNGQTEAVKKLISTGADVNAWDRGGNTLIHLALKKGSPDIAEILLNMETVNINAQNYENETPLFLATRHNFEKIIRTLLQKGVDINTKGKYNNTKKGNTTNFEKNKTIYNHNSLLHVAIENRNKKIISNEGDKRESSAIIELFLQHNINLNYVNIDIQTAIVLATEYKDFEIIKLLISHDKNCLDDIVMKLNPMIWATIYSMPETVKKLMEIGADVNIPKKYYETNPKHLKTNFSEEYHNSLLHFASKSGDLEIISILIDKGLDVNTKNWLGQTPLHTVLTPLKDVPKEEKEETTKLINTVKLLLENGADINTKDRENYDSPFSLAVSEDYIEIIQLMKKEKKERNDFIQNARTGLLKKAQISDYHTRITDKDGNTLLHVMAETGNIRNVKILIDKGAKLNAENGDGRIPLHLAIENGHTDIVKMLLEINNDVDFQTADRVTPLHLAIQKNQADIVEILLEKGADIYAVSFYGTNAINAIKFAKEKNNIAIINLIEQKVKAVKELFQAIDERDIEKLKAIQNYQLKITNENNKNEDTLLHVAAQKGDEDIIEILINKGADVNLRNADRHTSLTLAAKFGNVKAVKKILEISSEVDASSTDTDIRSALHWMAKNGGDITDIVEKLIEIGNNVNAIDIDQNIPLHYAAENGFTDIVERLIAKGAKVNATNKDNKTPLHLAIENNNLEVVKALINNGANIFAQTTTKKTPLQLANDLGKDTDIHNVIKNEIQRVNEFYTKAEKGTLKTEEIDKYQTLIKNEEGYNLLHVAAKNGNTDLVKALLNKGADINNRDNMNNTPLHYAAKNGYIEICEELIARNANLNIENIHEETLLHYAAISGDTDIIQMLLNEGANINAKNKLGFTPLHYAALYGHTNSIMLLKKNGADINAKNKLGFTPLYNALLNKHIKATWKLISLGANINENDLIFLDSADSAKKTKNTTEFLEKAESKSSKWAARFNSSAEQIIVR